MSLKTRASSFLCSLPKACPGTQLQSTDSILTDRHFVRTAADLQTAPSADLLLRGLPFGDSRLTASFGGHPETPPWSGLAPRRGAGAQRGAAGRQAPGQGRAGRRQANQSARNSPEEREGYVTVGLCRYTGMGQHTPRSSPVNRDELPQPPAPSPQAPVFQFKPFFHHLRSVLSQHGPTGAARFVPVRSD